MFILFGAAQGLLLGAHFLVRQRGDAAANRWLALAFLMISVHMGETMLTETALVELAPWAMGSTWCLVFAVGPAYFFHIRRVMRPDLAFRRRDLLHFLPAVLIFVDMLPWLRAPAEVKIEWQRHLADGLPMHLQARTIVKMAFHVMQNFIYLMASIQLVDQAAARLERLSADNDQWASLNTQRNVIRAFAGWSVVYLGLFFALMFLGRYGAVVDKTWMIIIAVSVQATGLVALNRPSQLAGQPAWQVVAGEDNDLRRGAEPAADGGGAEAADPAADPRFESRPDPEADPNVAKYRNSPLGEGDLARCRQAFEELMRTAKPYRDGSLRLADLAARLDISTHHLSQVLNQGLGGSFFAVINSYRVAEAKRLMEAREYDNRTLLAVAFDAGFNNKNSFNRAFRKETGQTPSAFWKDRRRTG